MESVTCQDKGDGLHAPVWVWSEGQAVVFLRIGLWSVVIEEKKGVDMIDRAGREGPESDEVVYRGILGLVDLFYRSHGFVVLGDFITSCVGELFGLSFSAGPGPERGGFGYTNGMVSGAHKG